MEPCGGILGAMEPCGGKLCGAMEPCGGKFCGAMEPCGGILGAMEPWGGKLCGAMEPCGGKFWGEMEPCGGKLCGEMDPCGGSGKCCRELEPCTRLCGAKDPFAIEVGPMGKLGNCCICCGEIDPSGGRFCGLSRPLCGEKDSLREAPPTRAWKKHVGGQTKDKPMHQNWLCVVSFKPSVSSFWETNINNDPNPFDETRRMQDKVELSGMSHCSWFLTRSRDKYVYVS